MAKSKDPVYHCLIDTGALVMGFTNEEVAKLLLKMLSEELFDSWRCTFLLGAMVSKPVVFLCALAPYPECLIAIPLLLQPVYAHANQQHSGVV